MANVWVDETRPLLGRAPDRLGLGELGVPYQLITDSMAASLMAQGQVMRYGSARIVSPPTATWRIKLGPIRWRCWLTIIVFFLRGGAANHLDRYCPNGAAIPIETAMRRKGDRRKGSFGAVQWAPENAPVYNPALT